MLDISALNIRTFDVKLDGKTTIKINPPKIKILRKLEETAKTNSLESLVECVAMIINCNSSGKLFDSEWVEENLDLDEMTLLISQYFKWVQEIRKSPN